MRTKIFQFAVTVICLAFLSLNAEAETHGDNTAETRLKTILDAQPDKAKARYKYRRPLETLKFLGIKHGMNVVEVLPGHGWYTKILLPYLGKNGHLVGVDYAQEMWPNFSFATEQFIERKKIWVDTWTRDASEWRGDDSATISASKYGEIPANLKGTADAVLFIRALHNLARYDSKGGYLSRALKETYDILKPGGLVGVVQHRAYEDRPDKWADGNNGYLKQSFVIKVMQEQGFELLGESDINANPKDQANVGDIVWRLPPSLRGHKDDAAKAAAVAIGESNRMTLKFRKPLK